jgi:hypothetical protein
MSMHSSTSGARPGSLTESLASLRRRLETTSGAAGRRRLLTGLVLGALLAFVAGYLRYLHETIREFAEPDVLVELAAANLEPRVDEEIGQVGTRLMAEAPAVMDHAEKAVLDAPPQIVAWAREQLVDQFDVQMSGLEDKVYTLMAELLQESLERARREGIDVNDDAQLDKLIDDSGPLVRAKLEAAIAELYAEYLKAADGFGGVVDRLTSGDPLDPAEQRQKELLVTGLAIIRKVEADPRRAPIQGVLRGDVPRTP